MTPHLDECVTVARHDSPSPNPNPSTLLSPHSSIPLSPFTPPTSLVHLYIPPYTQSPHMALFNGYTGTSTMGVEHFPLTQTCVLGNANTTIRPTIFLHPRKQRVRLPTVMAQRIMTEEAG